MTADSPEISRNVPLAALTTFGIGGRADRFAAPTSASQLVGALNWAAATATPRFVLGSGANILVGDGGIPGLVIHNRHTIASVDGDRLTAGSGALMSDLIERAAAAGLSGIEHYTGIPSTLGGALWQNLHFLSPDRARTCFIAEVVESATVRMADGAIEVVPVEWFEFGYDQSALHGADHVVIDATLRLTPAPEAKIRSVMQANQAWRDEKHPAGATTCSAGSIFQKLDGIGAGRLIDGADLKGFSIGGAQVSPHHANFIMNTGGATARDVRDLIDHVQRTVHAETGHMLQPEISFIGEFL